MLVDSRFLGKIVQEFRLNMNVYGVKYEKLT